ncbi:MAG: hypothetical protein ABI723_27020 [Bacteroidia bacterium]
MKILSYLSIVSLVIVLASCESKTFLRSKKKLNNDIAGRWRPISGTSKYGASVYDQNIQWTFQDGEVKIVQVVDVNKPEKDIVLDSATYGISTKIDNCFMNISDFKTGTYHNADTLPNSYGFDIKWTIIQLNGSVLDIAGRPHDGGMVEIEFEKK